MLKKLKISQIVALSLYYGLAQFLPNSPFLVGKKFRGFLCKTIFNSSGKNIDIEKRAYFGLGNDLKIGNNSGIGIGAKIYGIDGNGGKVTIGNNVMMASDVTILTLNHAYKEKDKPMREQGVEFKNVIIENDVWIGYRVTILPGVKVGKGSVIGAGAVVTKNVAPYTVVGGVPAKFIKERFE